MRASRLVRNRLLGTVHRLARPLLGWRAARQPAVVELGTMRRRLELLLEAMYGQPMRVVARGGPAPVHDTDVVLPASIPGTDDARARYRLLAIEQGERIVRGSRDCAPRDDLARDLYLVIEGAAIDGLIAARAPGLVASLRALRREALAQRPGMHRLVPEQRAVELRLRALLESEPGAAVPAVPRTSSAAESAAAALELAARVRETATRVRYRPVPPVGLWDDMVRRSRVERMSLTDLQLVTLGAAGSDDGSDGETPNEEGTTEIQPDVAEAKAQEVSGEVRGERTWGTGEATDSPGASVVEPGDDESARSADRGGVAYPEWIARHGHLEPRRVTVRVVPVEEGDDAWVRAALHEHGPLLRQVRDRFAMLRAHRLRLRAQRAGDDLDLDACVAALIDVHMGRVPGDRLYQTTRVSRHSLAIAILVDTSGSTRTLLPDGRSVLDVERLSLLLASEALDALGDPYAILGFSGLGRHDVRVTSVKGFTEHDRRAVQRRISSLEARDNTRLGAAVRHATALLTAQPAGRKVLLLLSDGRPNDVDRYQGVDAIEDSRQAIVAARAEGIASFCLTVDADEAEYLPHLFGEGGYRVITRPAQLPAALIRLVDRLLRG